MMYREVLFVIKKSISQVLSLLLVLMTCAASAEMIGAEPKPVYSYTWKGNRLVRSYQSETLIYTV